MILFADVIEFKFDELTSFVSILTDPASTDFIS